MNCRTECFTPAERLQVIGQIMRRKGTVCIVPAPRQASTSPAALADKVEGNGHHAG